jgi:hypothetical protein
MGFYRVFWVAVMGCVREGVWDGKKCFVFGALRASAALPSGHCRSAPSQEARVNANRINSGAAWYSVPICCLSERFLTGLADDRIQKVRLPPAGDKLLVAAGQAFAQHRAGGR